MAVYDLEEQEQISQLKGWWEQNGKLVTTIIVIAALMSVGWQGLRWYQNKQASGASTLYAEVERAVAQGDAEKARERTGQILSQYSDTAYAAMAALISGRAQVAAGDIENARAQLQWVADKSGDPAFRELARLNLATIALDQGEYQAGLEILKADPGPTLLARFEDLRGDLLAADGEIDLARASYQAALEALQAEAFARGSGDALSNIVRLKLESLGG